MLAEGLLIVALIIVILHLSGYKIQDVMKKVPSASDRAQEQASDKSAVAAASGASESYDEKIANTRRERLAQDLDPDNGSNFALGSSCPEAEQIDFAVNEYGAPGLDYNAWVSSQAVDDQVIKNHVDFVSNIRGLGPNGEFTGRSGYTPDSHDSYDPIKWIGLRRPEYVSMQNPTQVPDTDLSLYLRNRNFCLKT